MGGLVLQSLGFVGSGMKWSQGCVQWLALVLTVFKISVSAIRQLME